MTAFSLGFGIFGRNTLAWIPPEFREDKGEIETAWEGRLPKLINYNGLRRDIQIHTNWTDGNNSIIEMGQTARAIGLESIAITDHSQTLGIALGLNKEKLKQKRK